MVTLLNFISEFRNYTENTYIIESDPKKAVKGRQTNEAVTKMLLVNKDWRPDRILSLCSESVLKQPAGALKESEGDNARTAWQYYQDTIRDAGFKGQFISVSVSNFMKEAERVEVMRKISAQLLPGDQLVIDMTGGMRDTAMLMIAVARYLQAQKVSTVKVYYSEQTDRAKGTGIVRSGNSFYRMFDYVAAVEEFLSYGRADRLLTCVNQTDWDRDSDKKALLKSMIQFSDDITLCKVGSLNKDLQNLIKQLKTFQSAPEETGGMDDLMIRLLTDRFIETFQPMKDAKNNNLPHLVKWCHDCSLYQQALTLLCEQLPDYFCKHVFLQPEGKARSFIAEQPQNKNKNWTYPLFHFHFARLNLFEEYKYAADLRWMTDSDGVQIFRPAESDENARFLQITAQNGLLAFQKEDQELIGQAMSVYQKVYYYRNMIHHAGEMEMMDSIEKMAVTVENVKDCLEDAVKLMDQIQDACPNVPEGYTLLPIKALTAADTVDAAPERKSGGLQRYLEEITRIVSDAGSISFGELNQQLQLAYKETGTLPSAKTFGYPKLAQLLEHYSERFSVHDGQVSMR